MDLLAMNRYEYIDYIATHGGKIEIERPDYKWQRPEYTSYSCSKSERIYIPAIIQTFPSVNWIRQYTFWLLNKNNSLRIALYSEEYRLAIECYGDWCRGRKMRYYYHEREEYFKKMLGCSFIRFNPDKKDFNFDKVLREIYEFILSVKNKGVLLDGKSK